MKNKLRIQLSTLMFVQLCLYGMIFPIMSLYLHKVLNFEQFQIGIILSMFPVSTILSPIIGAIVADRILPAERVYTICMFANSILLFILSRLTSFAPFLIVYFLFMLFVGLTIPLSDSIVLHNLKDRNDYSSIRIWGSAGWVISGVLFSFFWLKGGTGIEIPGRLHSFLIVSSGISLFSFLFSFWLPKSDLSQKESFNIKTIFPVSALKIFLKKEVILALVVALLFSFTTRHYFNGSSQFLNQIGFTDGDIYYIMNIAVLVEIIVFYFLSRFIKYFGYKIIFLAGITSQIIIYSIFSFQTNRYLPITGFVILGLVFPFCISAPLMYIDSYCTKKERTGVFQFFTIFVYGIAGFIGDMVSGSLASQLTINKIVNYKIFWQIPLLASVIVFVFILFNKINLPENNNENP